MDKSISNFFYLSGSL